jgi:uncharacterized protein YdeI (YjbR/CyaY-like superfamily)
VKKAAKTRKPPGVDYAVLSFPSAAAWRRWLAQTHADSGGVWVRFFKKSSANKSLTHEEALGVALCYGWIDGQLKKYDEESWLHKFTPRRSASIWSKRNRELAESLIAAGKMRAAGLKEVSLAKADGRWHRAYDSPGKMTVPEDFLERLSKNKKAMRFFETLNRANNYAIAWRLQTAKKPETREKRMQVIIEMLAEGRTFH